MAGPGGDSGACCPGRTGGDAHAGRGRMADVRIYDLWSDPLLLLVHGPIFAVVVPRHALGGGGAAPVDGPLAPGDLEDYELPNWNRRHGWKVRRSVDPY